MKYGASVTTLSSRFAMRTAAECLPDRVGVRTVPRDHAHAGAAAATRSTERIIGAARDLSADVGQGDLLGKLQ